MLTESLAQLETDAVNKMLHAWHWHAHPQAVHMIKLNDDANGGLMVLWHLIWCTTPFQIPEVNPYQLLLYTLDGPERQLRTPHTAHAHRTSCSCRGHCNYVTPAAGCRNHPPTAAAATLAAALRAAPASRARRRGCRHAAASAAASCASTYARAAASAPAASMPEVSRMKASSAGFMGAAARLLSRLSRSTMSASTAA